MGKRSLVVALVLMLTLSTAGTALANLQSQWSRGIVPVPNLFPLV